MKLCVVPYGLAAVLAESLWLSGWQTTSFRLGLCGGKAAKFLDRDGKPEAFRKGRGQAAFDPQPFSNKSHVVAIQLRT